METKPAVPLSDELIKKLLKYYKFSPDKFDFSKLKDWECFASPSLERHECNARVHLPGNRPCSECSGNVDVPCTIGCDIQNFCLAVFAFRIGIGGDDLSKALQRNLYKRSPDELYKEVAVVLSCGLEALKEDEDTLEGFIEAVVEGKTEEPVESRRQEVVPDNLVTLYQGTKLIKISYSALKVAGEKGKIKVYEINGKRYVDPVDLAQYDKTSRRKRQVNK